MNTRRLPAGSFVRIPKTSLRGILQILRADGYRTVGPRVREGAIVYESLDDSDDLPIGYIDHQDGGSYRLESTDEHTFFDYVVGPQSLKNFLFPPREVLLRGKHTDEGWQLDTVADESPPLAVVGVRSCDLHALAIQDKIFLHGPYVDTGYASRRAGLFLIAVNCRRAADTCFCHSMKTGPAVEGGCDLALTELDDAFVVEVGTDIGGEVIAGVEWAPCTMDEMQTAKEIPRQLSKQMRARPARTNGNADTNEPPARGRSLDRHDLYDLLLKNLEHPRWQQVANRCLACANCTMVCPTCFCSSVDELSDLSGTEVERQRKWASCFTSDHSYMNSGTVRKSTLARYRQWLTHKLATWHDQFGVCGCTGCGRCITWCPVGIDLTEEVAAIRGD